MNKNNAVDFSKPSKKVIAESLSFLFCQFLGGFLTIPTHVGVHEVHHAFFWIFWVAPNLDSHMFCPGMSTYEKIFGDTDPFQFKCPVPGSRRSGRRYDLLIRKWEVKIIDLLFCIFHFLGFSCVISWLFDIIWFTMICLKDLDCPPKMAQLSGGCYKKSSWFWYRLPGVLAEGSGTTSCCGGSLVPMGRCVDEEGSNHVFHRTKQDLSREHPFLPIDFLFLDRPSCWPRRRSSSLISKDTTLLAGPFNFRSATRQHTELEMSSNLGPLEDRSEQLEVKKSLPSKLELSPRVARILRLMESSSVDVFIKLVSF